MESSTKVRKSNDPKVTNFIKFPTVVLLQNYPVDITLNTFIRQHAKLSGTKFMCLEGGCGACICVIKGRHPDTKEMKTWATNSVSTSLHHIHM